MTHSPYSTVHARAPCHTPHIERLERPPAAVEAASTGWLDCVTCDPWLQNWIHFMVWARRRRGTAIS